MALLAQIEQPSQSRTRRRQLSIPDALAIVATVILLAVVVIGPRIYSVDPLTPDGLPLTPPGRGNFFGTDELGRDVLARVIDGMGLSLLGALLVIVSGVVIGGAVGTIAGAASGSVDTVLMRMTDIFLAVPGPVLAIAVVAALGPGFGNTLLALSIVWWPLYARIFRGEVRRIRYSPHIEAARITGNSRWRILTRHMIPGAIPAGIVAASLDVGAVILSLAGLSFLGLGAPAPAPELGSMTQQGLTYLDTAWWVPIVPAVAAALLALVANFLGDIVRDRMRFF